MTNFYRKTRPQNDGFNYYFLEEVRTNGKAVLVPCEKDGTIITEKPKQYQSFFEKMTPENGWEQWNVEYQQLQSVVDATIKQPVEKPQQEALASIDEQMAQANEEIEKEVFNLKSFESCLQHGVDPAGEGKDETAYWHETAEITELKKHTDLLEKIVQLLQPNQAVSTTAPTVDFSEVLKEVVALSETVEKIDSRTAVLAHKAGKKKPTHDEAATMAEKLLKEFYAKLKHTPSTTIDDLMLQSFKASFKFQGKTTETQTDVRELVKFIILELTK